MPLPHDEFVTLLTAAQRRLWAFICTLVVDKADVEDILQETNLALWKMADQFEPGTDFVAWACRIAHYRVLRQRAAAKRLRVRLADAVVDALATEMLDDNRLDSLVAEEEFDRRRRALSLCLEEITPRHRTMLRQHYQDGTSLGDIGMGVGRNRKAIAQLFLRLRATLRSCIRKRMTLGTV